jgi:hypothetical protein
MAHQLDFCVTVTCDSQEALLQLERMLKLRGAGPLFLGQPVFRLVNEYRDEIGELTLEIHSVDINWDTTNEDVYVCEDCAMKNGLRIDMHPCERVEGEKCARCGIEATLCPVIEEG